MITIPRTPQERIIAQIHACVPTDVEERALAALSLGFESTLSLDRFLASELDTLSVSELEQWYARLQRITPMQSAPTYANV